MILPLCVKFCLTLPSPVYQFHKPLHQWHIRGLQSGATRALAWLTFLPHCKSWGNLSTPFLPSPWLFQREPVISTWTRVWGGAAKGWNGGQGESPCKVSTNDSTFVISPRSPSSPPTLPSWTAAVPILPPLLPSYLFSPHPRWPLCNPFHFLRCKLRSFDNIHLTGSLLCSKPFNSFLLSLVPDEKSTYLWEYVEVCACMYTHTLLQGRMAYDT